MNWESARSVLGVALRASGFAGRGAIWRLSGPDVQWTVHIDRLPYGQRLGIDIGLDLDADPAPKRPTDCPILLHLENLKPFDKGRVVEALDLSSSLDDERRAAVLEESMVTLGRYLAERLTLEAIRASFRAGEFESGFVHKDARAALENDVGPT